MNNPRIQPLDIDNLDPEAETVLQPMIDAFDTTVVEFYEPDAA